jgi:hypothetical protein
VGKAENGGSDGRIFNQEGTDLEMVQVNILQLLTTLKLIKSLSSENLEKPF